MSILNPEITVFLPDIDYDQTAKQTLNNFEPIKPWKYKQLWGLTPDPSCL